MIRSTAVYLVLLAGAGVLTAAPNIVCDAPQHNFGVRRDNEIVKHRYVLRNTGDTPLAITRVKASCGCTAVKSSHTHIAPGQTATIDARFTLKGRRGKQRKSILVESNDPDTPRLRLWLKGAIVVEVALKPRYINFRRFHKDSIATQTVELVSLRPDIRITHVESNTHTFEATIDPDGRGLAVRTVPPLQEGLARGHMRIQTNHPRQLTANLNIAGIAVGDLSVLPREIILHESVRESRRVNLQVRPFGDLAFDVRRVEPPAPAITSTFSKEPNGTVTVVLDGVQPDAALNGKSVVIHTNLESTPTLRVPIRVRP